MRLVFAIIYVIISLISVYSLCVAAGKEDRRNGCK